MHYRGSIVCDTARYLNTVDVTVHSAALAFVWWSWATASLAGSYDRRVGLNGGDLAFGWAGLTCRVLLFGFLGEYLRAAIA